MVCYITPRRVFNSNYFLLQNLSLHDLKIQGDILIEVTLFSEKKYNIENIEISSISIKRGPGFFL